MAKSLIWKDISITRPDSTPYDGDDWDDGRTPQYGGDNVPDGGDQNDW